ncbi:MAG: T9SS type A sorting domain-containing protein [Chitinophagaceae bacterium]
MKQQFLFTCAFLLHISHVFSQEVLHVQNNAVLTIQTGASITISGGIALDNGSRLTNNGIVTLTKNTKGGSSDWIDNGATAYEYGPGKLVLNSLNEASSHTLSSKNLFTALDINAGSVSLVSDIRAVNWQLINGTVNTGNFRAIVTGSTATALQAAAGNTDFSKSWFNGTLRMYATPATINKYIFPVGNTTGPRLAVCDNLVADALNNVTYIDAAFKPKPGTDIGLLVAENGIPDTAVSDAGVWILTPDAIPTTSTYDLLLYITGFPGLTDNRFAILRRPAGSANAADWSVPAGSTIPATGSPGRTLAGGYAKRNRVNGFGQFGIGIAGQPPSTVTVSMYPNPSTGQFVVIILGSARTYEAKLVDAMGKTLRRFTVSGVNNTTVTGLPAGIYFLVIPAVLNNGDSFSKRIVIIP